MEELYYIDISDQSHFVHEHIPDIITGIPFIFLNPIFDEKKRSQRFYAETARSLCLNGYPVIRFDYYGTGDSEGQLFELDLNNICNVVKILSEKIKAKYSVENVNLFGLRFGADIALEITNEKMTSVNKLILIEPITLGKRYIKEQRLRRKIFFKLNNIDDIQEQIIINEKKYEDHQGYPVSMDNLDFLINLNSTQIEVEKRDVYIFKLDTISSKKGITTLTKRLEENNKVKLIYSNTCKEFWSSLEIIDTLNFSEEIIREFVNS